MTRISVAIIFSLALGVILWPSKAQCVRCDTDPCISSATCGARCLCYKGAGEIRGRCVPR